MVDAFAETGKLCSPIRRSVGRTSPALRQAFDGLEQLIAIVPAADHQQVIDGIEGLLARQAKKTRHQRRAHRQTRAPFRKMEWVRIDPEPESFVFARYDTGGLARARLLVPFEIMDIPITQAHYAALTGEQPQLDERLPYPILNWRIGNKTLRLHPDRPAAWIKETTVLEALNARDDGYHYSLPSLIEWLYVGTARGQNLFGERPWGADPLEEIGWFKSNGGRHLHPVAEKRPLLWGPRRQPIWDLFGNGMEPVWAIIALARGGRPGTFVQTRVPHDVVPEQGLSEYDPKDPVTLVGYPDKGPSHTERLWINSHGWRPSPLRPVRYRLEDYASLPPSPLAAP
jgi:hypothetical protein